MDDMNKLRVHESIRKAVDNFGKEVIKESHFMGILSDYGAFNEAESIELIIKVLQSKDYCSQLLGLDGNESEQPLKMASYIQEVTEIYGFQRKYVEYAIMSIAYGLGWNVEPNGNVGEEITLQTQSEGHRKCRKCGAEVPEEAIYCIECGKKYLEEVEEVEVPIKCPRCGNEVRKDAKFCGKCGKRMYEAVDLGLSVKWASYNVGANRSEEYGGYYNWADPTGAKMSKYDGEYSSANPPSEISGTEYDIARAKWGGKWRMPTKAELQELADKCTWTLTTQNSVNGMKVVGPNGNSIFLPAAGSYINTNKHGVGTYGDYWSGTLYECGADNVYRLFFNLKGTFYVNDHDRYTGFAVRPVVK